jgi:hypothetical protein
VYGRYLRMEEAAELSAIVEPINRSLITLLGFSVPL